MHIDNNGNVVCDESKRGEIPLIYRQNNRWNNDKGSVVSIDQSSKLDHEKKSEKIIKNPTSITLSKMFAGQYRNDRNRGKII